MESRLTLCVVVILALVVDGGKAQLDVCGVAPLNKRIIGGSDAEPGSWPWMASLHSNGSHRCGGTLINNMWILMSASCFGYFNISDITVYLGRQTQEGSNPNEVSRTNHQLLKHHDFNNKTKDNDIALLKLSPPVNFTDYIRPICLAANGSDFSAGSTSWVTGWGTENTGVPLPPPQSLQEVDVPFVSNKQCNADYVGEREVTDNMICAGQEGKGTCFADSGGPLVVKQGKRWIQAGVVSWGDPACTIPIKPGVYTRVSRYQSWIEKQITSSKPVAPLPGFVYNSSNAISGGSNAFAMFLLSILPLVLSFYSL